MRWSEMWQHNSHKMIVELKVSLYFSLSGGRKEDFSWKSGDWLTQELLSSDWKLGSRHETTENNRTTIQPIRKKQLCVYQSDWNCFTPPRQTKILAHSSTQQSSNVTFTKYKMNEFEIWNEWLPILGMLSLRYFSFRTLEINLQYRWNWSQLSFCVFPLKKMHCFKSIKL